MAYLDIKEASVVRLVSKAQIIVVHVRLALQR